MMNHRIYTWAVKRIKALQLPELQPLGIADQYELDVLMVQVQDYEDACNAEAVTEYDVRQDLEDLFLAMIER